MTLSHTRTHTFARVDRTTRETVRQNGDLKSFVRQPTVADAFFLSSGHYRIETISGEVKVEAPTWIVFDADGYPYPVEPSVFERTWRAEEECAHLVAMVCPECGGQAFPRQSGPVARAGTSWHRANCRNGDAMGDPAATEIRVVPLAQPAIRTQSGRTAAAEPSIDAGKAAT